MAQNDDARFERIKTAVVNHGRWLQNRGGRRADLSFQDLSAFNLDQINLSGAKLAGANLAKARLRGANLSNADLFAADMEQCDLSGANLVGSDLRGANMSRCVLTDANLRGADFRAGEIAAPNGGGATVGGTTSLTEAKMERSILAGAYLSGCDLSGADLIDADLSGAELSQAIMIGVDLSGANLDGVKLRDTVADLETLRRAMGGELPEGALAEPAYRPMSAAALVDAVTAHEAWTESQGQKGARLDLDLVAVAEPACLAGRMLVGARLRRCRFAGGDWRGVDLQMADLSYASLRGVDLTAALAQGANFRRANLTGASLADAQCDAFVFVGGRRWPTNFDGVDLQLTDIRGANLTDAVFGRPDDGEAAQRDERRRYARYHAPTLTAGIGGQVYASLNWSLGGLSLRGAGGFRVGERLTADLTLTDEPDFTARADMVVVHQNRQKEHFSVRFDGLGQDLKLLLKRAFTLAQS